MGIQKITGGSVGSADAVRNIPHSGLDHPSCGFAVASAVAKNGNIAGNGIVCTVCEKLCAADNHRLEGIDAAAGDGLQP